MTLNIPINEAVSLIKAKIQKPISLRIVSSDTINIGYEIKVKLPLIGYKSKIVSIDLIIDKIIDTDLYFHYSTGIIKADTAINALLSYIPVVSYSRLADKYSDGHITLHLKEIKQLSDKLDKIKINSISFDKDVIMINFILI